jgi:hypothetical protein
VEQRLAFAEDVELAGLADAALRARIGNPVVKVKVPLAAAS